MNAGMRTRMWISLFVLVVFLAGLGAGIAGATWLSRGGRDPGFGPGGGAPPVPPMGGRVLNRMASRLDMSDEQRERLSELFDARRERFRAIDREMRRELRARFAAEQGTFRAAIAGILTPEQMTLFDAEIVRMGEERRGRRVNRNRGDRGAGQRGRGR